MSEQNGADLREMYKERDIFSNGSSIGYNNIIKQLEQKDHEINDVCILENITYFFYLQGNHVNMSFTISILL